MCSITFVRTICVCARVQGFTVEAGNHWHQRQSSLEVHFIDIYFAKYSSQNSAYQIWKESVINVFVRKALRIWISRCKNGLFTCFTIKSVCVCGNKWIQTWTINKVVWLHICCPEFDVTGDKMPCMETAQHASELDRALTYVVKHSLVRCSTIYYILIHIHDLTFPSQCLPWSAIDMPIVDSLSRIEFLTCLLVLMNMALLHF